MCSFLSDFLIQLNLWPIHLVVTFLVTFRILSLLHGAKRCGKFDFQV